MRDEDFRIVGNLVPLFRRFFVARRRWGKVERPIVEVWLIRRSVDALPRDRNAAIEQNRYTLESFAQYAGEVWMQEAVVVISRYEDDVLVRHLIEPAEGIHNFAPRAFER